MQPKLTVSPETTVPERVAVVVDVAIWWMVSAFVVRSLAQHEKPCGAVNPGVMIGAQAVCPATNEPA